MPVISELEIREFKREDNGIYSAWFIDSAIDEFMGPAWSDEELEEIENDKSGIVLSVFLANELVGVVSLAYPDEEHKSYGIMGIAVSPSKQRQGIGVKILRELQKYFKTQSGQQWVAFVSSENVNAQEFMVKCGWSKGVKDNNMYSYSF